MPQRNWALESQEFGAERSREGNQYRIQQGETVRQGLSSLVPGFQQAQFGLGLAHLGLLLRQPAGQVWYL